MKLSVINDRKFTLSALILINFTILMLLVGQIGERLLACKIYVLTIF